MNFGALAENLGLEEDEFQELVQLFIETSLSDLEALHHAVMENNAAKVRMAAHSIKGAANNLGLVDLYETGKEIEEKARDDQLDGLPEMLASLKARLDDLLQLADK
ncbi:MAG: Hpt domain-containing protein [Deltaproteobacteria bacterium]|nr:Hpt domain-containing protein [Deltaproteobacteria bacterium]